MKINRIKASYKNLKTKNNNSNGLTKNKND